MSKEESLNIIKSIIVRLENETITLPYGQYKILLDAWNTLIIPVPPAEEPKEKK